MSDDTTVKVTIGGVSTTLPSMSFAALKAALPYIEKTGRLSSRVELTESALGIVAVMLPDPAFAQREDQIAALEAKLLTTEIDDLLLATTKLLRVSNLIPSGDLAPGEAQPIG